MFCKVRPLKPKLFEFNTTVDDTVDGENEPKIIAREPKAHENIWKKKHTNVNGEEKKLYVNK